MLFSDIFSACKTALALKSRNYRSCLCCSKGVFQLLLLMSASGIQAETELSIRAKGDTGSETFNVRHLPGGSEPAVVVFPLSGESAVVSKEFAVYDLKLGQSVNDQDILQIGFTNDGLEGGFDRNLTIDWIEVDGRLYQTEDPSVYSQGNWNFDDCDSGFKQQETLHCYDGYFEFKILDNRPPTISTTTNPVIRLGDTLRLRVAATDPDGSVPSLNLKPDNTVNPPPILPDNGDGTRSLVWTPVAAGIQEFEIIATDAVDTAINVNETVTVTVLSPEQAVPDGLPLKQLGDQLDLLVGFAAILEFDQLPDTDLYTSFARLQFNIVTPENAHKWDVINPQPDVYDFTEADKVANLAACQPPVPEDCTPMVLHGHPLVWHQQLPYWVSGLPVGTSAEKGAVEVLMKNHIGSLTTRYKDQIGLWDVVNEALEDDGTYRPSVWYRAMEDDYIGIAFRAARESAPDASLIYNDYDIAWPNTKSDAVYEMLQTLLQEGVPIDGIGFQMHLDSSFSHELFDDNGERNADGDIAAKFVSNVASNFARFADLGLDIYITELDVTITEFTAEQLQMQAEVYRRVLEVCLSQTACKAVQMWGYTDRYSWLDDDTPLPIDQGYQAKPAFYAMQSEMQKFIELQIDGDTGDETGDNGQTDEDLSGDEDDENNEPGPITTTPFCSNGKINTLWFEYDADNDTSYSLRRNSVSIGDAINYYPNGVPIDAVIEVQSVKNRNRIDTLEMFTDVAPGEIISATPIDRGSVTLRFIVTAGEEQQQLDIELNCGQAQFLETGDEFGPLTFLSVGSPKFGSSK